MAWAIEISKQVLADFDDIYDSLAKYSPASAAKILRKLDRAIGLLSEQPHLGRPYKHKRDALRVLSHGDYLVFYRMRSQDVLLVRVIHGKRNIADILDEI